MRKRNQILHSGKCTWSNSASVLTKLCQLTHDIECMCTTAQRRLGALQMHEAHVHASGSLLTQGLACSMCDLHCRLLSVRRVTQTERQPRNTMNSTWYFGVFSMNCHAALSTLRARFPRWSDLSRSDLCCVSEFYFSMIAWWLKD